MVEGMGGMVGSTVEVEGMGGILVVGMVEGMGGILVVVDTFPMDTCQCSVVAASLNSWAGIWTHTFVHTWDHSIEVHCWGHSWG
jgi:hypothetical protein